jgi:hypothetical protein
MGAPQAATAPAAVMCNMTGCDAKRRHARDAVFGTQGVVLLFAATQ